MPDIVLATLNARYHHASFALRYLHANLQELQVRCELLEGVLEDRPLDFVERILALQPRILGLSVYIWNAVQSLEVVRLLRRVAPDLKIVLGGPEVTYEWQDQEIVQLADHLILHEGEIAFRELCRQLLRGEVPSKVLPGGQPPTDQLVLPYRLYTDRDLQERTVYVEASRGCPFRCEFCLSSLDKATRYFPLDTLLEELDDLYKRGARQFKFIDRTFNLKLETSQKLLDFFWERWQPGLFVHFEMVPDRFPEELRTAIQRFPAGALQFEIGIQTFDPEVQKRISRRQDMGRLQDNFRFLRQHTGVHIHADLIVGLPGETAEQFAAGFDQLVQLAPQEIQVGILKRLRGTPIIRHTEEWGMVYSPSPPYEVLSTSAIPFPEMMRLKRFARVWDVVANRGRFPRTLPRLLGDQPFGNFVTFSEWLVQRMGTKDMAFVRLAESLYDYLLQRGEPLLETSQDMLDDFTAGGARNAPGFLHNRPGVPSAMLQRPKAGTLPKRQQAHLA
jgi:hypothetical protein